MRHRRRRWIHNVDAETATYAALGLIFVGAVVAAALAGWL